MGAAPVCEGMLARWDGGVRVDWLIDWLSEWLIWRAKSHPLGLFLQTWQLVCLARAGNTARYRFDIKRITLKKKKLLTSHQMQPKESGSQSGGSLFCLCQILRCQLGFCLGHSLSLRPAELQGYTKLMVDCLPVTEGRLKGASHRVESSCSCFSSKCVLDISPKLNERAMFSVFCFQACQSFRFFRKTHKDNWWRSITSLHITRDNGKDCFCSW